jgi:TldD protein
MKIEAVKDLADVVLRQAEDSGAQYAEARIQNSRGYGFVLKNGEPQPSIIEDSAGIGIRIIHDGALAFSATNIMNRQSVKELTLRAVKMAKASKRLVKGREKLDGSKPARRKIRAQEKENIEDADALWLKSLLEEIDDKVNSAREGIKLANRILVASSSVEEKYIVNTDGAKVESRIPRINFYGILTAIEEGQMAQRTIQQGESGGLEVVKRLDLPNKIESEAKVLLEIARKATKPPSGVIDVILSPELSGIAAHESVGHPQEADRILGREGAQAGESYLKRGNIGLRVGSKEANVSDDPTLPHSNGYCLIDEEGIVATKRLLIKDGVINEFLNNRSTAAELDMKNNGSSRAIAFNREPIVRMSNTFVEPGDFSFEELVRSVKEGIYMKSFTEWNIDDKRLNQRYVGLEAYYIKNGEMKNLVRMPVLEITTPALWKSVKARSNRLEFEAAVCGKGDPMQGIPVWTGGPDTLLSGIKLGSR